MTNSTADRLVDEYLTRLAGASQALSPDRRTELLAEIRGHIAASLSGAADADEAAVRTMLDRIGDPADIVAAAVENDPPEPPSVPGTQGRRPGISLEVGAVVMLTAGSLVPVIGWLVGVILLWSSGVWRRSEKLLGTLIVPGGPGLALLIATLPGGQSCSSTSISTISGQVGTTREACTGFVLPPALGIALMLFVLIAPIVVAIVLISRARARTAPAHP